MDDIKKFISYYVSWLTGHDDLELDSLTEFEVIRTLIDACEIYERESVKDVNNND